MLVISEPGESYQSNWREEEVVKKQYQEVFSLPFCIKHLFLMEYIKQAFYRACANIKELCYGIILLY